MKKEVYLVILQRVLNEYRDCLADEMDGKDVEECNDEFMLALYCQTHDKRRP